MMITCTPCFILCSNNEVSVNLVSSFLFFLGREKGLSQKFLWPENPPESSLDFIFYFFSKKNETCAMVWLCHNSKVLRPFFKIPPKIVYIYPLSLSRRREIFILFPLNRLLKGKFLDISTYHQLYLLGRAHRRSLHTHTGTTET